MNEDRTSHIGTYTDGRVTQVYVNVGDFVHKGMVLARMHSHDVHETRAAYQTALQDVQRQRSALRYQEQTRDRMGRLYALKSASKQEVDKADTDVRSAQTDLANAETAVQKEVAHLTDILHLSASSLANIDETTEQVPVIAPASGTVVNRMITPGAVVEPGQEVFTVSDLSSVWMMASLIEADISKVHTGQRVRVLVQAYPDQPFEGMVQRAGPQLDTTTRTLQVRVVIPNAGQKLRPGMYSTAQIDEGESTPALFVPEEAIQDVNGGSMVFVRTKPGVFEARAVQIAQRVRGEAQISQGLKPGEAVVFKGAFVLKSEMLKSQIGE
jgi:multidrug efflux pump subunit AcrA (membrane-fusion protein)